MRIRHKTLIYASQLILGAHNAPNHSYMKSGHHASLKRNNHANMKHGNLASTMRGNLPNIVHGSRLLCSATSQTKCATRGLLCAVTMKACE
jgi:hypothetical protein